VEVTAGLLLELVEGVLDEYVVEVLTARWVSPLVDLTSNTPFCISRMEMSKVPPPRS
jgi:hypothetical protein